jgi:hypothetical protein
MIDNHRKRLIRIMPKLSTFLPEHQALTVVTRVKALMVAMNSVLEQLGWLNNDARKVLAEFQPPPLKNAAGKEVGQMQAVVQLSRH